MPSSQTSHLPANAAATDLPEVVLEVRPGAGRTATYTLTHVDFLIGTVPGCDLRVPGSDLPAVLCLLARRPGGLSLRRLAPTQVILVNGTTAPQAELHDGDRLTLGAMDIFVRLKVPVVASASIVRQAQKIESLSAASDSLLRAEREAFETEQKKRWVHLEETQRRLLERERELHNRAETLERERRAWDKQRDEAQRDEARLDEESKGTYPPNLVRKEEELSSRENELREQQAELERQRQEHAAVRQELSDIRKQLYDRYQERRDRLAGLQEAVDRAARKVQERKRHLDGEQQQFAENQAEEERRGAELTRLDQRLEEERRTFQDWQNRLQAREEQFAADRLELEARTKQYQADIVRLDRVQGSLEEREQLVQKKTRELDQRTAELQKSSEDLEQQVLELDECRNRLAEEEQRHARRRVEQHNVETQLSQRAAALEGQQATLTSLRTRLERQRDELRQQEQQLEEQRLRQDSAAAEIEMLRAETTKAAEEIAAEHQLREHERQDIAERRAVLEAAVHQLRQAQDEHAALAAELHTKMTDVDRRQEGLADREGVVDGRLAQLAESQERLDAERLALRERTRQLVEAEQAREALQEQLRRRSEELATRQKELAQQLHQHQADAAALKSRQEQWSRYHDQAAELLETQKTSLASDLVELDRQRTDLLQREETLRRQADELKDASREVALKTKEIEQQRDTTKAEQQEILKARCQLRDEFALLRREVQEFTDKLPDVDLQASNTLDRLVQAREQLRDHLAEVHTYARQCQEELEKTRARLQQENQGLQETEKTLREHQNEHRLAIVSFRQQMIDWQGQVSEMKRSLATGETRLERRQARVEEKARAVDATHQQLAQKTQELQHEKRVVAGRRQEMDRHLADMREWYRNKLRELAGGDLEATAAAAVPIDRPAAATAGDEETPLIPTRRDILSLTDPADPGDRLLGELLRKLDLVDADTLQTLLVETRRQRRSLRQVLLASGAITLYQMALIEAGNVDGLVLGPVRVIDRVRTTPQESIYRVFDPRRGQEALLRHLSEEEMRDPARAVEYRQRFTESLLDHPHLARTLEVLNIAGRPAVIQEWLCGLPSSDWPPLVAVPGVCFRLLQQAAGGLDAAHRAGVIHGHLHEGLLLLTADGNVKLCGLGEPSWLAEGPRLATTDVRGDLRALGQIVSSWCTPTGVRRGPKAKPLPEALTSILSRLAADGDGGYASAAQLLEELQRVQSAIPANAEAWDRLLRHVREHATPEAMLRQSA